MTKASSLLATAVLAGCALAHQASAFINPSLRPQLASQAVTRLSPSTLAKETSSMIGSQNVAPLQAATFQFDLSSILGGLNQGVSKIGNKKLVVITGTSSGLGKECARSLFERGGYYVVCAVRDPEKMRAIAEELNFPRDSYSILELDVS